MQDADKANLAGRTSDDSNWYRKDPALAWGMIAGLVAAWLYVAPIAFNQGALEAAYRESHLTGMVALTPYPQLYDDRFTLYASAVVTLILGFAVALPLVVRRLLTWWTTASLFVSTAVGLTMIFLWAPHYAWLWITLATIGVIGSACVAGRSRFLRPIARPAGWVFRGATAKFIVVLVAGIDLFLIIPAASGAYVATRPPDRRSEHLYLLLHMRDPASPLHEEVVELVASTTEYLVVRFSDKVPHPRQHMGPTTLPAEPEPGNSWSVGPVYFPMLVRRDSIDIITPSLDPDVFIAELRRLFSKLPVTTQPVFRVGREGAAVKVWTEYPPSDAQPSSRPITQP